MKKIIFGISGGVSFLVFLILMLVTGHLGQKQESQMMAKRWNADGGAAQVTCFFSVNAGITEDRIFEFEHTIDRALSDAGVIQESENPGARLWADTYSADGKITLSSDRGTVSADAVGIGGDFFLFHPLKLLYGAYFSGNDLMQDYCVIDEDAAWQLFGSSDVAGMTVYISGIPHIVTGVVHRPEGRLEKAAGLDSTLVYVSYQTLSELGSCNGINHYEIVMPNPVSEFAYKYIKDNLGSDEKETEVVENSSRYSLLSRLKLIREFGTRSMNGKAIIYPFWENIARGYEDILAVITLFEMLFLVYAIVIALVLFILWWRHKGWTLREKRLILQDKAERLVEKRRAQRLEKKHRTARMERLSGDEEPGGKEPGDEEPGDKETGDKEPGGKEPGDKEPGDKELGDKETVGGKPGVKKSKGKSPALKKTGIKRQKRLSNSNYKELVVEDLDEETKSQEEDV